MAAPSHSGATAEINDEVPSQEGSAQIEIPVAACPRFPPLRTSGRAAVAGAGVLRRRVGGRR